MKDSLLRKNVLFVNISFVILYLFWVGLAIGIWVLELRLMLLIPQNISFWFFDFSLDGFFQPLLSFLKIILLFIICGLSTVVPWVLGQHGYQLTNDMYEIVKRSYKKSDIIK